MAPCISLSLSALYYCAINEAEAMQWRHFLQGLLILDACHFIVLRRKQVQKLINIKFLPEKVYFCDTAKLYRFNITKHCPGWLLGYFALSIAGQQAA